MLSKMIFSLIGIIGAFGIVSGLCTMLLVEADLTKGFLVSVIGLVFVILGTAFGGWPGIRREKQDPGIVAHLYNLSNPFGTRIEVGRGEHVVRAGEVWRSRGSNRLTGPDYEIRYTDPVDWEVANIARGLNGSRGIRAVKVDNPDEAGVFVNGDRVL